jgi:hypothetical protein
MQIIPGNSYLLDNKVLVTVIKAINRSGLSFSVEIPQKGIFLIERHRLQPIPNISISWL